MHLPPSGTNAMELEPLKIDRIWKIQDYEERTR